MPHPSTEFPRKQLSIVNHKQTQTEIKAPWRGDRDDEEKPGGTETRYFFDQINLTSVLSCLCIQTRTARCWCSGPVCTGRCRPKAAWAARCPSASAGLTSPPPSRPLPSRHWTPSGISSKVLLHWAHWCHSRFLLKTSSLTSLHLLKPQIDFLLWLGKSYLKPLHCTSASAVIV